MANSKITWNDKVSLVTDPTIAEINKVTDSNMNEIKSVVNENADQVIISDTEPTSTDNEVWVDTSSNATCINQEVNIGATNPSNIPVWFKKGKNLCNNEILNLALNFQNNTIISDANSKTVYAVVPKNTDITISKTSVTNRFRVGLLNAIPQNNDSINIVFMDDDSSTLNTTINTSTYTIVAIQYTNSNQTTNIQVEIGETATAYEPYVRKAININGEDEYYTNDYSTEEQVIGTYLGKPLYRKVIDFGALPNATKKSVAHGISNIDKITKIEGITYANQNYSPIPLIYNSNEAQYNTEIYVGTKSISMNTTQNRSSVTAMIYLEYTKTTD